MANVHKLVDLAADAGRSMVHVMNMKMARGVLPKPDEYFYREYMNFYYSVCPPPTFNRLPMPEFWRGEKSRRACKAAKKPPPFKPLNDPLWREHFEESQREEEKKEIEKAEGREKVGSFCCQMEEGP